MTEAGSRKRRYESLETSKTVKAVFKKDDLDDSLSTSDWGLVIDDQQKSKRRDNVIKQHEEPLELICQWDYCLEHFDDFDSFYKHVKLHLLEIEDDSIETYYCSWTDCDFTTPTYLILLQHIVYHTYHEKLKCIGQNVVHRTDLPICTQTEKFKIPIEPNGFLCEWHSCFKVFQTAIDFFEHIKIHVYHNPRGIKEGAINCCWRGCKSICLRSQYKLSEHLRKHTKEKIVACPTCGHLFTNKTKFCDHRKRQTPIHQQSYLCSQCSKYFPSERLLRDHMRLHINHYKCSMCDMTCPRPSILANHIRYRHLKIKPYKCDQCDYTCVAKHNLDSHAVRHAKENLFKCKECDFDCRSEFGLKRHYVKDHGQKWSAIYECHICEKIFYRGGQLTKHLMKLHNYHWPSGHSRFYYKESEDGVYHLQTVRYETLEVTEEIIKEKLDPAPNLKNADLQFNVLKRITDDPNEVQTFDVVIKREEDEEVRKPVVITIDDLDSKGNILKSKTIKAREIIHEGVASSS